jgi:AraC-like DNA-binding protein
MSFSQNIQNQKMQRAASLLTDSDMSISAICEQVGYPSQNNFRKMFARHFGVTPSEYRKQQAMPGSF